MDTLPTHHGPPGHNQLLDALPAAELSLWQRDLTLVELGLGQRLSRFHVASFHVYFPTTALISLNYLTQDGTEAEIAVIGNEGMASVPLFNGGNGAPTQGVVQKAGKAYRLPAQVVEHHIHDAGPVLDMLMRYTQTLMTQVMQSAMWYRRHSIKQLLCRRLLILSRQSPDPELKVTHQFLANALGVRRESITYAALKLEKAGMIRYRRGHITVLDRQRLEQCAFMDGAPDDTDSSQFAQIPAHACEPALNFGAS